jgi:sporulation protein YlmC with PRC-barrel domain
MKVQKESLARRLALPMLLAGSLVVAGCSGNTPTPGSQIDNTQSVSATEPLAATDVATQAPTLMATEAATTAPTTAAENTTVPDTQQPAATLEGTAPAAAGTPGAGETAMPGTNAEQQVLVQASDLIGLNIQALDGLTLGTVRDVLVDQTGNIKYIVVELPAIAGAAPQRVVLDWTALQTVVDDSNLNDADLENVTLNFNGTAEDLADALPLLANQDLGAIINSASSNLPAELDNLVSLANLNTLGLQDTANAELGQLQDSLVDLASGKVDYVVLDLSAVGGASNTVVMVPWDKLTVDPVQAAAIKALVLDVTPETLQNAPPVDLSDLPMFFDPNQVNWETLQDFWDSLS